MRPALKSRHHKTILLIIELLIERHRVLISYFATETHKFTPSISCFLNAFNYLHLFPDINECITPEAFTCDTNTGGEKCVNLPGTFRCECNDNQGFVLVDGICQSKLLTLLMKGASPIYVCGRTDRVVMSTEHPATYKYLQR